MSDSIVEQGAAPTADTATLNDNAGAVAAGASVGDAGTGDAGAGNAETRAEGSGANNGKSAVDAAAATSAAEGRRLYIGNLAYGASDSDIRGFFDGYDLEAVTIPKNPRTDKPVGYAFVDLVNPADAERAITELAGKEVLERKVSVQIANKPDHGDENRDGEASGRARAPRSRGRSGRGRGGAKKDADGNPIAPAAGEGVSSEGAEAGDAAHPEGRSHGHRRHDSAHGHHQRRERGPPADGVPSKNKIMVANLPYDLNEEKLMELFAEYNPTSAKIAFRPISRFMIKKLQARNEPRKGRGFGFVTLANEEIQQKAVTEMDGKSIEGREIAVKVAVDSPDKTDEALAAKAAALKLSEEERKEDNDGTAAAPEAAPETAPEADAEAAADAPAS